MEQNKIKKRFYSVFIIIPLISLIGAKVLYMLASITASDIYYTGSSLFILRLLPHLCKYGYLLLDQLYFASSIAAIIYATTYFGKMTAVKAMFASIGAYIAAFIFELIFNLTRNSLTLGQTAAASVAMLSELLLTAAFYIIAIGIAAIFLKKSFTSKFRNRLKTYSVYRASLIPIGVSAIIKLLDVTFFNVIPFLMQYDNIRPDEIADIVGDYVYIIVLNFIIVYLLCILSLRVFKSVTGTLKPKYTGVSK